MGSMKILKEFLIASIKAIPKTIIDLFLFFFYIFAIGFSYKIGASLFDMIIILFFAMLGGNVITKDEKIYLQKQIQKSKLATRQSVGEVWGAP